MNTMCAERQIPQRLFYRVQLTDVAAATAIENRHGSFHRLELAEDQQSSGPPALL